MIYILISISLLYALFTLILAVTWWRMPVFVAPDAGSQDGLPKISVIIPVRNEEFTLPLLLADLKAQTYSPGLFEVIVADDSSTDNTLTITRELIKTVPYLLRPLSLANEPTTSPKKRAIRQSITIATGDLIVTTDGDCRVGPHWLETIAAFYKQTGARLISGPISFNSDHTVFGNLQTVESSSLIGAGACTMALGSPTMCNGANLTYEKRVFEAVGGFDGIDHVASGDDELLMHKIASRYPDGVKFLKSPDAIVHTAPQPSLRAFYHQRKRWASKWRAYQSMLPSLLAVFIFASNLAVPLAVAGYWSFGVTGYQLISLIALKAVPEWLFLGSVLMFLKKKRVLLWIPVTQLVYPLYVVFFGLAAQQKGFRWKGRNLH
ncbi:cellulose synthase/poly-beta-1,6-N-acetylglucosamine synthase-like glycosyltransferase [Larkinella arboricola]|uniref:Cellulose synthase/poly-beta-1,6-N-acetylglucosamine synthase-like glycosyltransferase n=1 Tax=Larkinella arboricola TaxID=643671 RepID=A0A327X1J3_LARAB|nr:glycosyltransferase [Larkinella arboricola]RAK00238.1 cellulose synthase/poly-beta-1,6-N-acetylglucosamine synthase-like glycosyltransferase [Larkinella arboricola]